MTAGKPPGAVRLGMKMTAQTCPDTGKTTVDLVLVAPDREEWVASIFMPLDQELVRDIVKAYWRALARTEGEEVPKP